MSIEVRGEFKHDQNRIFDNTLAHASTMAIPNGNAPAPRASSSATASLRSNVRIFKPRLRGRPCLHGRPLLDRIDIHMEVPRVAYDKLAHATRGEPSETILSVGARCCSRSPTLG